NSFLSASGAGLKAKFVFLDNYKVTIATSALAGLINEKKTYKYHIENDKIVIHDKPKTKYTVTDKGNTISDIREEYQLVLHKK
ncbi:MAG: hypothetical protein ACKVOU_09370, partial [Cytophagales bacterium]